MKENFTLSSKMSKKKAKAPFIMAQVEKEIQDVQSYAVFAV
jgi:hypothetical protein